MRKLYHAVNRQRASGRAPARVARLIAAAIILAGAAPFADGGDDLPVSPAEFSAAAFAQHVKILASDEFAGRAPGTVGEQKTVAYLVDRFQSLGLHAGNGDSFTQDVPVLITRSDNERSHARVSVGGSDGASVELALGAQLLLGTRSERPQITLRPSTLVFVGYGINAPQRHHNDYDGIDVVGKTVIMLAGVPDFADASSAPVERHRADYYSRSAEKFEEAARHGAVAAIVVHDTAALGYDWGALQQRWTAPQFALLADDDPAPRPQLQGWLSGAAAQEIFVRCGSSLGSLRRAARQSDFRARTLGSATFEATLFTEQAGGTSQNVIARLDGADHANEAIIYSAHWDHLGTHSDQAGDPIYHGALDNGSGVAAVLEVAAHFAAQAHARTLHRSVVFLLPTFEEEGLLGSRYYTAHPVVALADTVADINFDVLIPIGPARNFVVSGLGYSELDDRLRPFVAAQGRVIGAEDAAMSDSFFRSDHFSFALVGVPVLYLIGGTQSRGTSMHGRDQGALAREDYGSNRYHRPADRFDPRWDLRGTVQDIQIAYAAGASLADSDAWPAYHRDVIYRQFGATRRSTAAP